MGGFPAGPEDGSCMPTVAVRGPGRDGRCRAGSRLSAYAGCATGAGGRLGGVDGREAEQRPGQAGSAATRPNVNYGDRELAPKAVR